MLMDAVAFMLDPSQALVKTELPSKGPANARMAMCGHGGKAVFLWARIRAITVAFGCHRVCRGNRDGAFATGAGETKLPWL